MKLNLGCGDKILEGYVNVDVAEARAGMQPDVLCDLHALTPFENDTADEILSVHVVEHFWRWEVVAVLKEWVRVLKPGGRMVLECPNLISACEAFLADPQKRASPDLDGQRTMWVFYGDPAWQDPLMVHRWGYTPQSLAAVMQEAGLTNVRQEPAQFKLREPRDMRLVGDKPARPTQQVVGAEIVSSGAASAAGRAVTAERGVTTLLWLTTPRVMSAVSGEAPERGLLSSPIASARVRMGVAASHWANRGYKNLYLEPAAATAALNSGKLDAQICIVPKFSDELPIDPWLLAIRTAKRAGCQLLLDVCDYPFGDRSPLMRAFYAQALALANAVTVNSARMSELMSQHFSGPISVIEDAVLDAMAKPAFAPARRLKMLWFGHPTNLRFLEPWIDKLIAHAPRPCRLVLVTLNGFGVREAARKIHNRFSPHFEARFVEWSLEATRRELEACDLVILPCDPTDVLKGGASANRIAEVLNAGRFAIANPLRSYLPFTDAAWLGADLLEGIRWAAAHPDEVLQRIQRGQALLAAGYTRAGIGEQWTRLFEGLAGT